MTREEATKQVETALDELADALDRGHSQQLIAYLAAMARFYRYTLRNVFLIAAQRPDATHVAGFQTWKKLGRFVKQGEHGISIIAPIRYRRSDCQPPDALAQLPQSDLDDRTLRGFRIAHVFDIAQTDGPPLPEFAQITGDPAACTDRLKAFVASQGIALKYDCLPGGADGASENGVITLRPGMPPAEEFSVLAHEAAHELLHKGDRRPQTTLTIRETEAEAVSFVVCRAVGLDVSTHSSDYIQSYRGNRTVLADSLAHIQQTASQILAAIELAAPALSPCMET